MKNKIMLLTAACAALFSLPGCVGYTVGSSLPPGIKTVHIPTFINACSEPRVEIECTAAAIQEFQKDGSLRVVNLDNADSLLTVEIIDFSLIPLRYQKDNAKATKEYRLLLKAQVMFKKKSTGETVVQRKVMGESTFELTGDLTSAKRTALPLAAKDLAHDIVESVVEYW